MGVISKPSLLQKIVLTTQITKYRYIATNEYYQKEYRIIEDMKVVIRKPNTLVQVN